VPVTREQLQGADRHGIRAAFDRLYEQRYAHHSPEEPVELVNVRLAVIGRRAELRFPLLPAAARVAAAHTAEVYLGDPERSVSCPVYRRENLGADARFGGPALVREHGTTTVMFEGDACSVAPGGELIIAVRGER